MNIKHPKQDPKINANFLIPLYLIFPFPRPTQSTHVLIVHSKLKRLDITPLVCTVEQIRLLRGLGGELMIIIV